jgi:hypothetical protein
MNKSTILMELRTGDNESSSSKGKHSLNKKYLLFSFIVLLFQGSYASNSISPIPPGKQKNLQN